MSGSLRRTLGPVMILAAIGVSSGLFSGALDRSADAQTVRLTDSGTTQLSTNSARTARNQPGELGIVPGGVIDGVMPSGPIDGTVMPSELMPGSDFAMPGGVAGADCGFGCPSRWYVVAEAMYLNRQNTDDGFRLSNFLFETDFDYELGGRITVGRTYDCLDGWEATYTGHFRWEDDDAFFNPNQMNALFVPGNGVFPADLSTFYFADFQAHRHVAEMDMVEAYQRWWGWDVISVKAGGKYINLEEGYGLISVSNGNVGEFLYEGDNHIGLVAGGIDLLAPIGRWTFGSKLGGGMGINFNDGGLVVVNDGNLVIGSGDSSEEFAWMAEVGFYSIFRLTERISLHAGYEAFYLWGLNIAAEQDFTFLNFDSGTGFDEKGHALFHGATAGVEIVW